MEIILTFSNANYAIGAENVLLHNGLTIKVMPLPSLIGEGCGICLRMDLNNKETAVELLIRRNIPIKHIYKKEIKNGKNSYEVIHEKK